MGKNIRRAYLPGMLALFFVVFLALSFPVNDTARAASRNTSDAWQGTVNTWANVRTGPNTGSSVSRVAAPGTSVTVYETVSGQAVSAGNSNWLRVSNSPALYIYSSLVSRGGAANNGGGNSTPSARGKLIVVSITQESFTAYENGNQVYTGLVNTAQPGLVTPTGTFHVFQKLSPTTFYSPFPKGSSYWYAPTYIHYALAFQEGGYFLHDAWWRAAFGPGTQYPHYDSKAGWISGSHGCVSMSVADAEWLYNWTPIGTTVQINQ